MPERVTATPQALDLLERLRTQHGDLIVHVSGGCCDGSSPMCFPEGELLLGPNDLLLGEVGGAPFYIDAEQYERWNRPAFLLDVALGPAEGFSLEGLDGVHFITRTTSCPASEQDEVAGLVRRR